MFPVAEELLLVVFLENSGGLLVIGLSAHAGHDDRLDEMHVPWVFSLRLGLAQKLAAVDNGLLDVAWLFLLGGYLFLFLLIFAASEADVDGVAVRFVLGILRAVVASVASSEHPLWFDYSNKCIIAQASFLGGQLGTDVAVFCPQLVERHQQHLDLEVFCLAHVQDYLL